MCLNERNFLGSSGAFDLQKLPGGQDPAFKAHLRDIEVLFCALQILVADVQQLLRQQNVVILVFHIGQDAQFFGLQSQARHLLTVLTDFVRLPELAAQKDGLRQTQAETADVVVHGQKAIAGGDLGCRVTINVVSGQRKGGQHITKSLSGSPLSCLVAVELRLVFRISLTSQLLGVLQTERAQQT